GTHLANIEPNRNQGKNGNLVVESKVKTKPRVETITGISKHNYWQWPIAGPLAGYIVARPLPHFGTPAHFSPAAITSLCNEELHRPEPKVSTHTEPQSNWTMALPKPQEGQTIIDLDDTVMIDNDMEEESTCMIIEDTPTIAFPWNKGWAL
ncbi:9487_t:CDS:2, partial [Racocetra persica]